MELKQILEKENQLEIKIKEAQAQSQAKLEAKKQSQEQELNSKSFLGIKEKELIENNFKAKRKEIENEATLKLAFALKELNQKKERNLEKAVDFVVKSVLELC
ncbi:hypothetical protein COX24_01515 [bacterium (Candidatus Gribaldobacteria) CG23_combo_of_CG06-09_8_20_14_all_37_87_8]|uniref:Uncharacterized protein n=2 Tax=Candidatus Gribaldobacteria TaxID=2798536 RepID=A0A2G9ZF98_9BACT|nr:MAG: hypothetical protein AUJ25_01520 [Parcubacteria group bacterium CG1_02_37_13]PIP31827.1 MAG: hypothetical protein COX24_01515 [bacterium (Candidatus Gribaldobacteria) CG23_combo_of_CG06-09_8_20_14_all_37_87_8]PIR90653.1 MAG: hypothetical protein COU05_00795 [bacterium (Candidatus Gribaldobacteria) CG10_big_fil_rev_8_21_14_0_10_37_21]